MLKTNLKASCSYFFDKKKFDIVEQYMYLYSAELNCIQSYRYQQALLN